MRENLAWGREPLLLVRQFLVSPVATFVSALIEVEGEEKGNPDAVRKTEGFMKLISVNVGLPREVTVGGKTVLTSIWKYPVQGRVHVSS